MEKPLLESITKYLQEDIYPLNSPGHKGGRGLDNEFTNILQNTGKSDISLPNDCDIKDAIEKSQKLTAKLYGSDAAFWCVNGTNEALMAMILCSVNPGDKVLVARDSHVSVFDALFMAKAEAVYYIPEFNKEFGISTQIRPKNIEEILTAHRGIKAVIITSPNYYGITADLASIAYVCHKHEVLLLVDETYGAHLGFNDKLPLSALRSGADACVQGTHKWLGAMTQASVLHIKTKNIDEERAKDAVAMFNATNPNYLILASLDAARAQLAEYGNYMTEAALMVAEKLRSTLKVAGIKPLEKENVSGFELDRTKVLANLNNLEINGSDLAEILRKERIAVELVDERNILFVLSYADENPDFYEMLIRLRKVLMGLKKKAQIKNPLLPMPQAEIAMTMNEVFYAQKEKMFLSFSIGKIVAEPVIFYPPGVPVLLPGEKITPEILNYIEQQKNLGALVKGVADNSLETIRVIKQ